MTRKMGGNALALTILLFSVVSAAAQTYTQMQWGVNKSVTPYAFGANINGTWRNLGTVSAAGAWNLSPSTLSVQTWADFAHNYGIRFYDGAGFTPGTNGSSIFNASGTTYIDGYNGTINFRGASYAPLATFNPTVSGIYSPLSVSGAATLFGGATVPSAPQNISITPVWNAITTLTSLNVQGTTASTTTREFLVNFGMNSNKGTGVVPSTAGPADKVTLGFGMNCNAGSIACWAGNSLLTINGPLSTDFWGANIHEFDINNNSGTDIGVYTGKFNELRSCEGTSGGVCYVGGFLVTGYGTHTVDYGVLIAGVLNPSNTPALNRGIVVAKAIQQAYEDSSNATTSYIDFGSHTNGINLAGAYSTYSIAAPNFSVGGASGNILTNGALNVGGASTLNAGVTVGVAGSTVGVVAFKNATSGTITLQPATGALGTVTATLPANTGTIAETNLAQTWTAIQTFDTLVKLKGYTVSTLPTCNAGAEGSVAYVTDATAPTYDGALTGGGAVKVPVFCNGAAWRSH